MNKRAFSYYKGRTFEYKVKHLLENMGYFVIRSAKSAFPDLVAVKQGKPMLVECKVNRYLPWEDKVKLIHLGSTIGAKCVLAYNDNGKVRFKLIRR